MALFAFVKDPVGHVMPNDGGASDYTIAAQYIVLDNVTGSQDSTDVHVNILATDNATQMEVKIRDAVIADAANRGNIVSSQNFFMPAIRRG